MESAKALGLSQSMSPKGAVGRKLLKGLAKNTALTVIDTDLPQNFNRLRTFDIFGNGFLAQFSGNLLH